ncbi:MAG: hypothetical protein OXQ28_10920, partial [Acidobacteriota bacterium]|nr:hypothetical protein [Acidobacteriota bacterium]
MARVQLQGLFEVAAGFIGAPRVPGGEALIEHRAGVASATPGAAPDPGRLGARLARIVEAALRVVDGGQRVERRRVVRGDLGRPQQGLLGLVVVAPLVLDDAQVSEALAAIRRRVDSFVQELRRLVVVAGPRRFQAAVEGVGRRLAGVQHGDLHCRQTPAVDLYPAPDLHKHHEQQP